MFLKFKNISFNTDNVGFIEYSKDNYYLSYKKKASIQKIKIDIPEQVLKDPIKYFARFNFFSLNGYFINPNNITFIQEELIFEEDDRFINITLYFKDAQLLQLKLESGRWRVWKDIRLISGAK